MQSLSIVRTFYRRRTDAHFLQSCRDSDTLVFYLAGGHEFTFKNESFLVGAHQVLYLPKNSSYKNKRLDIKTSFYQIDFEFLSDSTVSAFDKPIVLSKNESEIFLPLLRDTYTSFTAQDNADLFLCSANIFKALSLLKNIADKQNTLNLPIDKIAPTITFLEEHYAESTSISQLAELSDMSVSNLEKHFIKNFNCSPITYRNKIRLRHAKLLLAGGFSANEAAYNVGFSDVFYFSRIFKKLEGITPSAFAKQNKGL